MYMSIQGRFAAWRTAQFASADEQGTCKQENKEYGYVA